MNLLAQSAFLKAIGWALLHSLWQMGVLWLGYVLLTADGKKFQSRQRYNLALLLVALGTLAFIFTLTREFYQFAEPLIVFHQYDIDTPTVNSLLAQTALWLDPALPLLSIAYLFAIALLFIRFFRQYYFSRQLINSGLQKVNPEFRLFLSQMAQRFAISKKIRIGLSDIINTPLTVGFWKPVILLPIAAINHLSLKQTEAIILHELNHIKQNDYLVNLLIACLDILLFFNPFSRMLSSILMKERENSCDDIVLQFRYPASEYAHALLVLEQHRSETTPLLAISATGTNKKILLNRVQRILHGKTNVTTANYRMVAFLFSAFLIAFTGWYNPAKEIHRKLPDAFADRKPVSNSLELMPSFYPPSDETEPATTTIAQFARNKGTTKLTPFIPEFVSEEEEQPGDVDEESALASSHSLTTAFTAAQASPATAVYGFMSAEQPRDFSIQENVSVAPAAASPELSFEVLPYVPSYSFSYQYTEDTSFPKKYIPTPSDIRTKEDLEKTLMALELIDWEKLVKKIGEKNESLNIAQLQAELKKALTEVDWKKIDEELKAGLKQADQELRIRQAYIDRLTKVQKDKVKQQQAIIMDRLMQNEKLQQCEVEGKKIQTTKKVKKVVVI